MFSMEQITTALSFLSLMTSISNSFHPRRDSSTRADFTGLSRRARSTWVLSWVFVVAMAPPTPPRVKEGRMTRGRPVSAANASASCTERARMDFGTSRPMSSMAFLNRPRSSASRMESTDAPMTSTPHFSRMPSSARSSTRFRAVCPPMVGRIASGRSVRMISST